MFKQIDTSASLDLEEAREAEEVDCETQKSIMKKITEVFLNKQAKSTAQFS